MDFSQFLRENIVLFDGAFGTMLQKSAKNIGTVPELLNLERPELIAEIHRAYAKAGADVITAYYRMETLELFAKISLNARLLGGRRAIIMSGEYDKVLPMDIYMEFLIKAMIAGNIDKMEALGAYEIAPEDVALCEFVCTSKMPLQAIVRKALDNMRSELE